MWVGTSANMQTFRWDPKLLLDRQTETATHHSREYKRTMSAKVIHNTIECVWSKGWRTNVEILRRAIAQVTGAANHRIDARNVHSHDKLCRLHSPPRANQTSILRKQKDASPHRQIQHSALCGFDSGHYLFHPLLLRAVINRGITYSIKMRIWLWAMQRSD